MLTASLSSVPSEVFIDVLFTASSIKFLHRNRFFFPATVLLEDLQDNKSFILQHLPV